MNKKNKDQLIAPVEIYRRTLAVGFGLATGVLIIIIIVLGLSLAEIISVSWTLVIGVISGIASIVAALTQLKIFNRTVENFVNLLDTLFKHILSKRFVPLSWISVFIVVFFLTFTVLSIVLIPGIGSYPQNIATPTPDISDGNNAFDTTRPDGQLKLQASTDFNNGNITGAVSLWHRALQLPNESNDAEALIYLEDQQVVASGKPYITFVIGTTLTGVASNISAGRDNLQGAYVAQKEYNDGANLPNGELMRLLIANAGSQAANATTTAQEIVRLAQTDKSIVGVMGWPFSSYVINAVGILSQAHIPMVSSTASDNLLSGISPYFFHVTPSNQRQAVVGAHYAEQQLHAKRVAVFVDPNDAYSESLAQNFSQQFLIDGNQVVTTEIYTIGSPNNLSKLLQNALAFNPDLIYFAGYADDMSVLLADLPPNSTVQFMGGDALYALGGYPTSARASFGRLHFTAFASPDEWLYLHLPQPPFFAIYADEFDPNHQPISNPYGYSRPDSNAILSYDAMSILLYASNITLDGGKTSLTTDKLRQNLAQITGSLAFQGVSGQISFGSNGDPINKAIVVLSVDQNGDIHLAGNNAIQGCFMLSQC